MLSTKVLSIAVCPDFSMELIQRTMVVAVVAMAVAIGAPTFGNSQLNATVQNVTNQPQAGETTTNTTKLVTPQGGTSTPTSGDSPAMGIGHVKIVSTCKFDDKSCNPSVIKLFTVRPLIFRENALISLGEFPASAFGRTIDVKTDGSTQYIITQETNHIFERLFNTYTAYSPDCENQIKPGESKVCTINTTLYWR